MARRGKKPEEVASKWPGVTQAGSGAEAKMYANKKIFRQGLVEMSVDGTSPTAAEADNWFERAIAAASGGGAAAPAPAGGSANSGDGKDKGGKKQGQTVELVSLLKKAREAATVAQEEEVKLHKAVKALHRAARTQQSLINAKLVEQKKRLQAAEEAKRKAAAEQQAAEAAAAKAREEAKNARLSRKAEEKAKFDARIDEKRAKAAADEKALAMGIRSSQGGTPRNSAVPARV